MADFDRILSQIEKNIDDEVNLFNNELMIVLKRVRDLVPIKAVELYGEPLRFDYAMQEILSESGYYALIDKFINESYDTGYMDILSLFDSAGLSATFTADDVSSLSAIKQLDSNLFMDVGAKAANSLKADLYKYALSDTDKATMINNMKAALEDTELVKYSGTYADTAISNYNQAVIDMKAVETDSVYIYQGVKDSKTRQFCRCLLEQRKYYSKKEADRIKNDKRRQWNCRHLVVPVSVEFAEGRGFKSGTASC